MRLSQFHTTALCSPTRASLLTGRNATTVGMATIEEFTDGFPNCSGRIPFETALLSEVLAEQRLQHLLRRQVAPDPLEESNLAATKRHWPTVARLRTVLRVHGRRDRPVVSRTWCTTTTPSHRPATPEDGYHLSKDIADKTIEFIRDAKVIAPDKPWFTYVCPGRRPRAAPRLQGVGRQVRRQVRHGLRALPRDRAGEPEAAGHRPARHRTVAGQPVSRTSRGPTASRGRCRTPCGRGTR